MSSLGGQLVDSHLHLWDRGRFDYAWLDEEDAALRRDFLTQDLDAELAGLDSSIVSGVVAVQADCRADQSLAEAEWLHGLASEGAPILAIVAAAELERGAACSGELNALADLPLVGGVRRLLQGEAPGFALRDDFVEGVRMLAEHGFVMDLCVRQSQIAEATELARRCGDVTFVLDHLGKPEISDEAFGPWSADLARLADLPNVLCKLSGLMSEAPAGMRDPASLRRWLVAALDEFGPNRCMFGSDWPLVATVATYGAWVDAVSGALDGMTISERIGVMGATALSTYVPGGQASRGKES